MASRANLYLVKYTGHLRNTKTGEIVGTDTTNAGIVDALNKITDVVLSDDVPRGKAVIAVSSGM